MSRLMIDHPGWFGAPDGRLHRVVANDRQDLSLVTAEQLSSGLFIYVDPVGSRPVDAQSEYFDPDELAGLPTLQAALHPMGVVSRVANPSLWDALGTAILAQYVAPKNMRHLHNRLCQVYGNRVRTTAGDAWLFPTPETLLRLRFENFVDLQLRAKADVLQAASRGYLDHGRSWRQVIDRGGYPGDLVDAISATTPQLGHHISARAVADFTNNFATYPADHLLRSSVARLLPHHSWPADEARFLTQWRTMTGNQLARGTLLVLAWGTESHLTVPLISTPDRDG